MKKITQRKKGYSGWYPNAQENQEIDRMQRQADKKKKTNPKKEVQNDTDTKRS